ncbi:uncharacterized protein PSFLO_05021 [Pseudozyma flocculosa]|uniref:Uncharacterized protein n=1 Tax=Pseudozyma flocculosa TaxID=84751 RepID=A0A5C3F5X6_9BASI|nr:uncharacterized protein PSFLO_05021 [Pseudozyma flocculosa]
MAWHGGAALVNITIASQVLSPTSVHFHPDWNQAKGRRRRHRPTRATPAPRIGCRIRAVSFLVRVEASGGLTFSSLLSLPSWAGGHIVSSSSSSSAAQRNETLAFSLAPEISDCQHVCVHGAHREARQAGRQASKRWNGGRREAARRVWCGAGRRAQAPGLGAAPCIPTNKQAASKQGGGYRARPAWMRAPPAHPPPYLPLGTILSMNQRPSVALRGPNQRTATQTMSNLPIDKAPAHARVHPGSPAEPFTVPLSRGQGTGSKHRKQRRAKNGGREKKPELSVGRFGVEGRRRADASEAKRWSAAAPHRNAALCHAVRQQARKLLSHTGTRVSTDSYLTIEGDASTPSLNQGQQEGEQK